VHEINEYRAARVCHKQFVSTIISDAKNYLGVSIQVQVDRKLRFGTLNFVLRVPEEEQYNNTLFIVIFAPSSCLHRASIASKTLLLFQLMHNRLICRHNIKCVYTDEHRKNNFVVLAKRRTAPWWLSDWLIDWYGVRGLTAPMHLGPIYGPSVPRI
jgi:hypothetical protein